MLYLCILFVSLSPNSHANASRFVLFMLLTQYAATAHRILVLPAASACYLPQCGMRVCVPHAAAFPQNEATRRDQNTHWGRGRGTINNSPVSVSVSVSVTPDRDMEFNMDAE